MPGARVRAARHHASDCAIRATRDGRCMQLARVGVPRRRSWPCGAGTTDAHRRHRGCTMDRLRRALSVAFTLLCAAFALWIASARMSHPVPGVSPGAAAAAPVQGEQDEAPSNEVNDFPQLD